MLRIACYTLIGLCLTIGCDGTHKPAPGSYIPAISVAVGVAETESGAPSPEPDTPSEVCENCGGTGQLGDGTVSVVCPVCEGTGKPTTPPPRTTTTTPPTGRSSESGTRERAEKPATGTAAMVATSGASGAGTPKEAAESHDATQAGMKPAAATLPHWLTYAEWVQAPHNRPVVMYWHRLNCGPCRVWERTVLDHPAVQDFLAAKFDCVEIDGATAMNIFGVRSTPSVIVGRRGRWELYQGSNLPRDPDHFVALLEL